MPWPQVGRLSRGDAWVRGRARHQSALAICGGRRRWGWQRGSSTNPGWHESFDVHEARNGAPLSGSRLGPHDSRIMHSAQQDGLQKNILFLVYACRAACSCFNRNSEPTTSATNANAACQAEEVPPRGQNASRSGRTALAILMRSRASPSAASFQCLYPLAADV